MSLSAEMSADRMSLSHNISISRLLKTFGTESCKTISRFSTVKRRFIVVAQVKQIDYRRLARSISYMVQTTRPDLASFAQLFSRSLYNP